MKFKTPNHRKEWVTKQVRSGKSFQEIGAILRISRQRVFQLFHGFRSVRLDKMTIPKLNDVETLRKAKEKVR